MTGKLFNLFIAVLTTLIIAFIGYLLGFDKTDFILMFLVLIFMEISVNKK